MAPSPMAHSAVASLNNVHYMFGGYNGISSDRLYRQNTSSNWCGLFTTEISCGKVRNCVWCEDTSSNLTACYLSNHQSHLVCNTASTVCQNGAFAMPMSSSLSSWSDVCIGKSGDCNGCIQGITAV